MATYKNDVPLSATGHLTHVSLASGASNQTTGAWVKADKARGFLAYCYCSTYAAGSCTFAAWGDCLSVTTSLGSFTQIFI